MSRHERTWTPDAAVIVGLFLLALAVRAVPLSATTWPIGDGGLFAVMAADVRANGWAVPAFTSYNGGTIPFAYPPVGIYLLAIAGASGTGAWPVMAILAGILSAAIVPVVFLVSRTLLGARPAVISAVAFALIPGAESMLVAGGGVPRALGLLFALLGIWLFHRAMIAASPSWISYVGAGVLAGLAAATHPHAAVFAALSMLLVFFRAGRTAARLRMAALALALATVTSAVWWAPVLAAHGVQPLLEVANTRSTPGISFATFLFVDVTGASFAVFLGIALLGLVIEMARRHWFLPIWLVMVLAFIPIPTPPLGDLSTLNVVISMLIGIAISDAVLPAVKGSGRRAVEIAAASLLTMGLISNLGLPYAADSGMWYVTADQRSAMTFVHDQTAAGSRFAIVTGRPWPSDFTSEWFPAITERISVSTVQGTEWQPGWAQRVDRVVALQDCADRSESCLADWISASGSSIDFVFIPKGRLQTGPSQADCCGSLRESLVDTHVVIYDGPGATIVAW